MDLWPYAPQNDIGETWEWLTDSQRCKSREYRQALRIKPRQELQLNHRLTAAQFGQAKVLARGLGAGSLYVPLWQWFTQPGPLPSGTRYVPKDTSDPAALTAADTKIMLWESPDNYEVLTVGINSMTPVYPYITLDEATTKTFTRPLLVPLRTAQFAQEFEASRSSFDSVECSARFRIQAGDDYSAETGSLYASDSYTDVNGASHPVVVDRSLATSGVREQFERRYEEIDSAIGGIYRYPTLSAPEQSGKHAWSAQGRAGMRALLYWLHSRQGQWKSFWVPSWNADMTVTHEIAEADTSIEIADIGLRINGTFPTYIMVDTTGNWRVFCRVTGATAGSAGHEVIGLSDAFGHNLYTWEIARVCVLTLSRFASDRIEINYAKGGNMSVSVPTMEATA